LKPMCVSLICTKLRVLAGLGFVGAGS
jgi:hypothetical protein